MSIFEDFYEKERFIANRKTRKQKPQVYRLWRNRVLKFLEFCDGQHLYRISDISQIHYDSFIAHISKTKSKSTIRDWKYALSFFIWRSHLPIKVQTSPLRQASKRKNRAFKRLIIHFDNKTTTMILDILDELI